MNAKITPALHALRLEHAEAFKEETASALIEMDALAFYRWAADRQYEYAKQFARAARLESRKCGKCNQGSVKLVQVGPYTVCEPCAAKI